MVVGGLYEGRVVGSLFEEKMGREVSCVVYEVRVGGGRLEGRPLYYKHNLPSSITLLRSIP